MEFRRVMFGYAVDRDAHRHGLVHRDRSERAREVAERRADVSRAALHALGDDAVDADAGGIHEDTPVQLADVDHAAPGRPKEPPDAPQPLRIAHTSPHAL